MEKVVLDVRNFGYIKAHLKNGRKGSNLDVSLRLLAVSISIRHERQMVSLQFFPRP